MIEMVIIRRKRHVQDHTYSTEAIAAHKELMALGDCCTCAPRPEIPPFDVDHYPDPNDSRYRAYYSAPPPLCPMCEARNKAKTKVHILGGFRPWWRSEEVYPRMAALHAA